MNSGNVPDGWRKSSYSGTNGCVEVERLPDGDGVLVRDSKRLSSPTLYFTMHEWRAFLAGVRGGEFDLA